VIEAAQEGVVGAMDIGSRNDVVATTVADVQKPERHVTGREAAANLAIMTVKTVVKRIVDAMDVVDIARAITAANVQK
jgi:hypothetical protein